MKPLLVTTTAIGLCLGTTASAAGLVTAPTIEPEVIVVNSSSSGGGVMVPLLLLVLAGAVLGSPGGGGAASDRRLKEDIRRVGTTRFGLPLYRFRYKGMPQVYEGVMAQDVEPLAPGAVQNLGFGIKGVNYAALGLEMRRVA